jgi:hypothetical protein
VDLGGAGRNAEGAVLHGVACAIEALIGTH